MKIRSILGPLAALLMLSACGTPKKILYFQDLQPGISENMITSPWEIRIRPNDKISIIVNSRDPLLMSLFNLPVASRTIGSASSGTGGSSQGISGYTVNKDGSIDFPVLGRLYIEGMTREEIASYIKAELINQNLVKDPIVTVEFMNLTISVLGEVTKPGQYNIDKEKITILDAISMAGDLTIYGKRENIMVMREENGVQQTYSINLCSADQVYSSPVYYLRQNDVVYVEPNDNRARQSTVNGNTVRSTSFWLSLASFITTISLYFIK